MGTALTRAAGDPVGFADLAALMRAWPTLTVATRRAVLADADMGDAGNRADHYRRAAGVPWLANPVP
jgi:hypothetical protein